jgi:hypothetical protein
MGNVKVDGIRPESQGCGGVIGSDRRRPAGIGLPKKAMDLRLSIFKARVFFGAGAN